MRHDIYRKFQKWTAAILAVVFSFTSIITPDVVQAQILPASGTVIGVSPAFTPALIKGLTIDPQDAFHFEFIVDAGDTASDDPKEPSGDEGFPLKRNRPDLQSEYFKLIKYFLASLALPEQEMWVNLSPVEKDRIIPEGFGSTDMGRDLLAQDYILKQLTSTLMSPENEEGKKFWEKVYERLYATVETQDFASLQNNGHVLENVIQTFNKVWIVPQTGYFYEHDNTVFIVDAKLKVMLESDYLASAESGKRQAVSENQELNAYRLTPNADIKDLIRSVIIPIIEDEVNNGENFANLRQIYNAMLLSVWFKKRMKEHLLGQVYADQKEVSAISYLQSSQVIEGIWSQYVETFRSGAANVIKEEYDPVTQTVIPRKYFTGGAVSFHADGAQLGSSAAVERSIGKMKNPNIVGWRVSTTDAAMLPRDPGPYEPNWKRKQGEATARKHGWWLLIGALVFILGGLWVNDWNFNATPPETPQERAVRERREREDSLRHIQNEQLRRGDRAMMAESVERILQVLEYKDYQDIADLKEQNIDDLVLLGSDALDTFHETARLFIEGVGKRIVICGGYGRLTMPLVQKAVKAGFEIRTEDGVVINQDNVGDFNETNRPRISESAIIQQVLMQMVEKDFQDHVSRFTPDVFVLEQKSTNSPENIKNYRDIIAQQLGDASRPFKALIIQSPRLQLRAMGTFQSVFKDQVDGGKIEALSYTTRYIDEGLSQKEIVKDVVGEVWRLIVYFLKGDIIVRGKDFDGLSDLSEEFWSSALSLFENLKSGDRQELASYFVSLIPPGFILEDNLLNALPDQARVLVNLVMASQGDFAMMSPEDLEEWELDSQESKDALLKWLREEKLIKQGYEDYGYERLEMIVERNGGDVQTIYYGYMLFLKSKSDQDEFENSKFLFFDNRTGQSLRFLVVDEGFLRLMVYGGEQNRLGEIEIMEQPDKISSMELLQINLSGQTSLEGVQNVLKEFGLNEDSDILAGLFNRAMMARMSTFMRVQVILKEKYPEQATENFDEILSLARNVLKWADDNIEPKDRRSPSQEDLQRWIEGYEKKVGGVDLSTDQADIQIQTSENGFKFPKVDPAMLNMDPAQMVPVILDIRPMRVQDVYQKLGLAVPASDTNRDSDFSAEKAVREDQLSAL